ncbi:MAG: L-rhamnose/proton symporter RhaT, partial [Bacteroidota bacterium]|nr:L-rhamnose/proton symporter RhaT [Bacteroidota bacterium]
GIITITGVVVALAGISICGWAATLKDHELKTSSDTKDEGFNTKKGFAVALVAGIMSACFAFGEKSGQAMVDIARQLNPDSIWVYNPVYAILLIGGFTVNVIYCVYMSIKRKSFSDFKKPDTGKYYGLAALAGLLWFSQFVFKGMGTNKMSPDMSYITWCLLFSLVIVFSNLIGLMTGEWKGVSKKTLGVLSAGLLVMLGSVLIIGFAPVF